MALKSAPRASLSSSGHSVGGQVPEGDYTIKECKAGLNTYAGTQPDGVPAIGVVYTDGVAEYQQWYKAGDNDHLVPTKDGEGFEHPDGRSEAKIYGGGSASVWLKSMELAGFEVQESPGLSQFEGLKVHVIVKMIKLGQEKKDTPVPIIDKILPAGKKPAPVSKGAAKASSNGDLDSVAVQFAKEALSKAPDQTLPIAKLGMNVWFALQKTDHKPNAQDIKQMIVAADDKGNLTWIDSHSEFQTDGESVRLA